MTMAKGAMARLGAPAAAMVRAAIGTPIIMLASMCRRVVMGNSFTVSIRAVIMSFRSSLVSVLLAGSRVVVGATVVVGIVAR